MSLLFNNTEPETIKYNGNDVEKVSFNGIDVWDSDINIILSNINNPPTNNYLQKDNKILFADNVSNPTVFYIYNSITDTLTQKTPTEVNFQSSISSAGSLYKNHRIRHRSGSGLLTDTITIETFDFDNEVFETNKYITFSEGSPYNFAQCTPCDDYFIVSFYNTSDYSNNKILTYDYNGNLKANSLNVTDNTILKDDYNITWIYLRDTIYNFKGYSFVSVNKNSPQFYNLQNRLQYNSLINTNNDHYAVKIDYSDAINGNYTITDAIKLLNQCDTWFEPTLTSYNGIKDIYSFIIKDNKIYYQKFNDIINNELNLKNAKIANLITNDQILLLGNFIGTNIFQIKFNDGNNDYYKLAHLA